MGYRDTIRVPGQIGLYAHIRFRLLCTRNQMKKIMLMNHFTWMQYLEGLTVLLIIYYGAVFVKFYLPEIQNKWQGHRPAPAAALTVLQYQEPDITEAAGDPLVSETELLIGELKQAIGQGYQPAAIQKILQDHPMIKDTQLRPAINELVVTECEKNGAALLTEAEVNEWWEA